MLEIEAMMVLENWNEMKMKSKGKWVRIMLWNWKGKLMNF